MKYYSMLIISVCLSSKIYANSAAKRDVATELVQKLEALDPNIKSHQTEWLKVRHHLEQAAQQSESTQGLKLSVQHILDQWIGLRFRILDESDAQYWALNGESLTLPRAWFERKGSRWVVQYAETDKLRRGDHFLQKDFDPFSKENQKATEWKLPFEKAVSVSTQSKPLSAWNLELSQQASKSLIIDNEKVCVEKVWFWLDKSVSQSLVSKFESGLCQAMLLDLRDVFGEGREVWPALKKKIPIAVITNQGTREGAARLAASLQKDFGARVIGEPTDSDRLLQKAEDLDAIRWKLIVIGDGGQVTPNEIKRDSFLNSEGVDDLKEAALAYLRKTILD
ncbi:MAG: hypothetical protein V4655_02950 [Bdellovibrionota bacterium]